VKKKVEDVLVKVVRVIANASISEEIGEMLTGSSAIVDLLLKLLGTRHNICYVIMYCTLLAPRYLF